MEAGNTLNRPSPSASAAVLPVFGALRRFLCVLGILAGIPLTPWLYCSDTAFSRLQCGFLLQPLLLLQTFLLTKLLPFYLGHSE